jgi:hypothetical protein
MERTRSKHSSCLWFQILAVETDSFLPDQQSDRCNLARQRQTCHVRPDSLGQQCRVELLERTGLAGSDDRGTLEEISQIVIAIGVESTNRYLPVRPSELPFGRAIGGAAVRLDAKAAEGGILGMAYQVPAPGRFFISIAKLFGDSVIKNA